MVSSAALLFYSCLLLKKSQLFHSTTFCAQCSLVVMEYWTSHGVCLRSLNIEKVPPSHQVGTKGSCCCCCGTCTGDSLPAACVVRASCLFRSVLFSALTDCRLSGFSFLTITPQWQIQFNLRCAARSLV